MSVPFFSLANQEDRADNIISGTRQDQVDQIRKDITDFKTKSGVEKVIVLWTANTERFADVQDGLNMTADQLLESIKQNKTEIAPSTLFAVASILEGVSNIYN